MRLAPRLATALAAIGLSAMTLQARAENRSQLVACQAMVDRAAQAAKDDGTIARPDNAELTRCRQIVREWMLRDARMSVDERGQPLR